MPQAADKRGVIDVENAMRFDPGGGQEQGRRLIGPSQAAALRPTNGNTKSFSTSRSYSPGGEPPAPACARRFSPGEIHRKGTLALQGGDQILTHQPGENVVADKERYVFHASAFFALKIGLLNTILLISRVMDSIAEV